MKKYVKILIYLGIFILLFFLLQKLNTITEGNTATPPSHPKGYNPIPATWDIPTPITLDDLKSNNPVLKTAGVANDPYPSTYWNNGSGKDESGWVDNPKNLSAKKFLKPWVCTNTTPINNSQKALGAQYKDSDTICDICSPQMGAGLVYDPPGIDPIINNMDHPNTVGKPLIMSNRGAQSIATASQGFDEGAVSGPGFGCVMHNDPGDNWGVPCICSPEIKDPVTCQSKGGFWCGGDKCPAGSWSRTGYNLRQGRNIIHPDIVAANVTPIPVPASYPQEACIKCPPGQGSLAGHKPIANTQGQIVGEQPFWWENGSRWAVAQGVSEGHTTGDQDMNKCWGHAGWGVNPTIPTKTKKTPSFVTTAKPNFCNACIPCASETGKNLIKTEGKNFVGCSATSQNSSPNLLGAQGDTKGTVTYIKPPVAPKQEKSCTLAIPDNAPKDITFDCGIDYQGGQEGKIDSGRVCNWLCDASSCDGLVQCDNGKLIFKYPWGGIKDRQDQSCKMCTQNGVKTDCSNKIITGDSNGVPWPSQCGSPSSGTPPTPTPAGKPSTSGTPPTPTPAGKPSTSGTPPTPTPAGKPSTSGTPPTPTPAGTSATLDKPSKTPVITPTIISPPTETTLDTASNKPPTNSNNISNLYPFFKQLLIDLTNNKPVNVQQYCS